MPTVDLLVVGGGIHGTCVARDAALRGLSVVLVEKDDLASGTSSRSSKLIHGGIRYLETKQFGLVREALRERSILLATAPALVRPVRFLLPFYRGTFLRPRPYVRAGLLLYDLLAGKHGMARHRNHSASEALTLEPGLPREGLLGAAEFSDAQMDDAGLVVANAVAAAAAGAMIRTRTELTALTRASGEWRAELAGGADTIVARAVVNAAGPWLDIVRERAAGVLGVSGPALRLTRGTHVVVPRLTEHPLLLFARNDFRVFFVLPWGLWSLVGTTDKDESRPPDEISPTVADIMYLWEEIALRWPDAPNPARSTVRAFAGLRPLAQSTPWNPFDVHRAAGWSASDSPREARLVQDRGMISLAGGKFTTARSLAESAVDLVVHQLEARVAPCTTATAPLAPGEWSAETEVREAQVLTAIDQQFAQHVDDVVFRRSRLWLDGSAARGAAPAVAGWMGDRFRWDEARRQSEVARVHARLEDEEQYIAIARQYAEKEPAR